MRLWLVLLFCGAAHFSGCMKSNGPLSVVRLRSRMPGLRQEDS